MPSLLGRIAVLCTEMRPIATDKVPLFVGLSVCHDREPCKTAAQIEVPFGLWTRVDPKTMYYVGERLNSL